MRDNDRPPARGSGKPGPRKPGAGRPGASKPGPRKPGSRTGGSERSERGSQGRPPRDGARSFDKPRPERERKPRPPEPLADGPRHDDPPVDEDATPKELDRGAWRELSQLTKENAEWVAGHLVMAGRVIDEDPSLAHRHALAASRRAGRIPVVRETLGITAYVTGDFALALRELRTFRRLSGKNDQVPMMMDCERGLGRPARALELASEVDRNALSPSVQVELAIARSGARLDLGQPEMALRELEIPYLTSNTVYSFSPALFDSYAVVLAELGREEDAKKWGRKADIAAEALEDHQASPEGDTVVVVEIDEESPS